MLRRMRRTAPRMCAARPDVAAGISPPQRCRPLAAPGAARSRRVPTYQSQRPRKWSPADGRVTTAWGPPPLPGRAARLQGRAFKAPCRPNRVPRVPQHAGFRIATVQLTELMELQFVHGEVQHLFVHSAEVVVVLERMELVRWLRPAILLPVMLGLRSDARPPPAG